MGIIDRVRRLFVEEKRATVRVGGSLENPPTWLEKNLLGVTADDDAAETGGVPITSENALSVSAVWACVRAISEDVAKLPLILYRETGGKGKERLKTHPLYRLLHDAPNPDMSSFDFRSTVTAHALLTGNGYGRIYRDGVSRPSEFEILDPTRVEVRRSTVDGSIVYVYRDPWTGKRETIFADDILHIRGLGFNGLVGYSVVEWARRSLGLTAAAEKFGAAFFGNSSTPKGVLEHPGELDDEGEDRLRKSWEAAHRGPGNANRVAILEDGLKFKPVTIPPEDAQFLETRQFQIAEVCRWFRMPPHKVADLSRATFSNIEHSSIEYVGDTLMPWLVRWEQEIRRKCFTSSERNTLAAEHLVAALLRGDLKSRYEAYAIGKQWGWLNSDRICEMENLNPIGGRAGEVYLVPVNMADAETIGESPTTPDATPTDHTVNNATDNGSIGDANPSGT